MESWAAVLEGLPLARTLRASAWLYPLVNAGHLLGIALLLGAIVPLDLRLLGAWRRVPLAPLWEVLGRMAMFGLALAILFGSLLFIARATEYIESTVFLSKMACVMVGAANALWLRARSGGPSRWPDVVPLRARVAAGVSLAVWPVTMVLGRWIGYT